jgi:hypothetical protein
MYRPLREQATPALSLASPKIAIPPTIPCGSGHAPGGVPTKASYQSRPDMLLPKDLSNAGRRSATCSPSQYRVYADSFLLFVRVLPIEEVNP